MIGSILALVAANLLAGLLLGALVLTAFLVLTVLLGAVNRCAAVGSAWSRRPAHTR